MAVVASATGAAVFGLSGVAAGLAGGALLGAGAGALYSGLTGDGNILNSALTGALLGGAVGGLGAGFAGMSAAGGAGGAAAAPLTGTGALAPGAATTVSSATPALTAAKGSMLGTAYAPAGAAATQAAAGLGAASAAPVTAYGTLAGAAAPAGLTATQTAAGLGAGSKAAAGLTGKQMLGYGLAGTGALSLLGGQQKGPGAGQLPDPGMVRPYEYSSTPNEPTGTYPSPYTTAEYTEDGNPILDTRERNYFSQNFTPMEPYSAKSGTVNPNEPFKMAAAGGLMYDDSYGMDETRGLMQGNLQKGLFGQGYADGGKVKHMFGGGLTAMVDRLMAENPRMFMPKYEYDNTTQRYNTISEPQAGNIGGMQSYRFDPAERKYQALAGGGHLGDYSDGGRLLKGPGDGVSDDIPATIADKQPARLADGEFVIPARIVSELGNGSTDAGAKRLYAMMDRIQAGRKKTIGKKNVAKDTKAKKHLLA